MNLAEKFGHLSLNITLIQNQVFVILTAIMVHLAVPEVNPHGIKVIIENITNQDRGQDPIGEGDILLLDLEVEVEVEAVDIKIILIENIGKIYL